MKDFKVKIDYNTTEFVDKTDKLIEEIKEQSKDILKRSALVFANAAAKYTPPMKGNGSMNIPNEKYLRPYVYLKDLVEGNIDGMSATEIDKHQLRNGMKYKILNDKNGNYRRAPAFAYCRTASDLKKLRRIKTRGLAKAMWGASLTNIGVNIPVGIQRLINKSPDIGGLPYSKTTMGEDQSGCWVTVENMAKNISNYAMNAERKGFDVAMKELRFRLAAIANKERKV